MECPRGQQRLDIPVPTMHQSGLHALLADARRTPGVKNPLGQKPWVNNPLLFLSLRSTTVQTQRKCGQQPIHSGILGQQPNALGQEPHWVKPWVNNPFCLFRVNNPHPDLLKDILSFLLMKTPRTILRHVNTRSGSDWVCVLGRGYTGLRTNESLRTSKKTRPGGNLRGKHSRKRFS